MFIIMMTNVGYFVVMVNSHIIYFISLLHSTLHITHDLFGRGDEFASYKESNHVSPNILNHDPYDFISTTYKKYIFSFDYFLTWEVKYVLSTGVAKIGSMSVVFFFLNRHLLAFFATVILTSGSLRMLKTISKLFIFVSLLLQTERIFVILSKF